LALQGSARLVSSGCSEGSANAWHPSMSTLTQERLKELLDYDPETGVFTWLASTTNRISVGDVAGSVDRLGYRRIALDRRDYKAHRLAWLYMTGEWPTSDLDHINCDKDDNRIANLRLATEAQNGANRRKNSNNTSGYKGVSSSRGRWRAEIRVNGRARRLGHFTDPAAAHAAYVAAAEKHFGEFARVA
jgi:hypothetical protein